MKKLRYRERYGIKASLRGYQRRAAALGTRIPTVALLMDPRLGKTRVDIAITGYHWLQGNIKRWVIIGPAISKEVWAREIAATLDVPYKLEILEGSKQEREILVKGWKDEPGKLSILVMNFEATWRLKKFLYKWNPDRITVDESHRIKHRTSKQSKTIRTLGRRAKYRSILTGTLMAKPTDVFAQYDFLAPGLFPTRWADFLERYADKMGYGGYKPETYKNLDELNEKVHSVAFHLTREMAGGFPEEHYQNIYFRLGNPSARHYRDMLNTLKTIVDGDEVSAPIVLVQGLRLQQITSGFLPTVDPEKDEPTHFIGKDRLSAFGELIDEYPLEEPLVVMYKFKHELEMLEGYLKRIGRTYSKITGGMSPAEKAQAQDRFQLGKANTCLVQIRAGGISIDLSRADTLIFYSLPHSVIDYEQAKARIIARTGGRKSFLRIVASDTVDEDILTSLEGNIELATLILERL